jgi:hypothetical protein
MRFNPPDRWFGPARKLGQRGIVPQSWEGWVILLGFLLGLAATGVLHDRSIWAGFFKWAADDFQGKFAR